ncbi:MAG: hypothetical protein R3F19_02060 [Verrucomicrobiales bacterium]
MAIRQAQVQTIVYILGLSCRRLLQVRDQPIQFPARFDGLPKCELLFLADFAFQHTANLGSEFRRIFRNLVFGSSFLREMLHLWLRR